MTQQPPAQGVTVASPLHGLTVAYAEALQAMGRSPRTIEWYGAFLAEFMRFAARSGQTLTLADLTPTAARRWLVALQSRPRPPAPASLAGRVRTLKAFGAWLAAEYELEFHPLRGLRTPRVPQVLIRSLREPDLLRLIEAAARSRAPERDLAIILFMVDTGLRVSEVAGLSVRDIDLEAGRCRVLGKGAKERVVPVGRRTRSVLRQSLALRSAVAADAPLFVGPTGHRLSSVGLQNLVRRLAARGSLEVRCSPHVLRHTFARTFLANGGDVFSLQRILGHSPASLEITRRYVQLLDDDLRETHRRASPVDHLSDAATDSTGHLGHPYAGEVI